MRPQVRGGGARGRQADSARLLRRPSAYNMYYVKWPLQRTNATITGAYPRLLPTD